MWRWLAGTFLVVLVVVSSPRVGFVTSESMEPALRAGDAFLAVRAAPGPGSVIVYRPRVLPQEHVVHRVVAQTPSGFLTRGDRSPESDQAKGEPPVTADRIVGVVVEWGGQPLRLPGARGVLEQVQRVVPSTALAGPPAWLPFLAAAPVALNLVRPSRRDARALWRTRVGTVLRSAGIMAAAATIVAHLWASGDRGFEYLVTESPGPLPLHVRLGSGGEVPLRLRNPGFLPVVYNATGVDGTGVEPAYGVVPPLGETELRALVPPENQTGWRKGYLRVYIYPALAPPPILWQLHQGHPLLAIGLCLVVPLAAAEVVARLLGPTLPLGRLLGLRRPR